MESELRETRLRKKLRRVIENGARFTFGVTEIFRLTTGPDVWIDSHGNKHTDRGVDAVRYLRKAGPLPHREGSLLPTWQSNRFDLDELVRMLWWNRRFFRGAPNND